MFVRDRGMHEQTAKVLTNKKVDEIPLIFPSLHLLM